MNGYSSSVIPVSLLSSRHRHRSCVELRFQGTFKEGIHDGFVMKELCEFERRCCELLQNDLLRDFVPMYNGVVQDDSGKCRKRRSRAIKVKDAAPFLFSVHRNGGSTRFVPRALHHGL